MSLDKRLLLAISKEITKHGYSETLNTVAPEDRLRYDWLEEVDVCGFTG